MSERIIEDAAVVEEVSGGGVAPEKLGDLLRLEALEIRTHLVRHLGEEVGDGLVEELRSEECLM